MPEAIIAYFNSLVKLICGCFLVLKFDIQAFTNVSVRKGTATVCIDSEQSSIQFGISVVEI